MRRPESARDRAERRSQPFPERAFQLVRAVADDHDPGDLEPEPDQLAREERPVAVGELSANELAAGDEDGGARPRQPTVDAGAIPLGVTMKTPTSTPGAGLRFPLSFQVRLAGWPTFSHSFRARKRCVCPCSSVP